MTHEPEKRRRAKEKTERLRRSKASQRLLRSEAEFQVRQRSKRRSRPDRRVSTTKKTIELNKPKSAPKRLLEAIGKVVGKTKVIGKKDVQISPLVKVGVAASVLPAIAGGAAAGGAAVITRTATLGKTSLTTQRAFAGRSAASGLNRIFHKIRPIARRFGTNTKTKGLTTSLLVKVGLGFSAAGLFVGAVSSYPFAGFIKEEALQTLGFAFNTAERNKDIEGMTLALDDVEDILSKEQQILDLVPYVNVVRQLRDFFDAARTKLEVDARRLDSLRGEQEAGESAFGAERRVSDEQALQRRLEEQGLDSEYFALIRDGKFEEAEELRQTRLKGGNE